MLCDVLTVPLREGDMVLLCSEGVWSAVPDTSVEQIIAGRDREPYIADQLVRAVLQHDGNEWACLVLAHLANTAKRVIEETQ